MELNLGKKLRQIIGHSLGAEVAEFQLEKAIQDARISSKPKTVFYDPTDLFMGREWLVKKNVPLSFNDLRQMAKNPIISSIINTRINQIASFCAPQVDAYEQGYVIKSVKYESVMKTGIAEDLKHMVYNMGIRGYGEPLLEIFARKFMRDSLVMDQACAEIVSAKNGSPAYIVAVDSATIRRLPASMALVPRVGENVYAQVLEDKIVNEYTTDELMFGIRNPVTDMGQAGYGMSEMEVLVRIITTILNTERYNAGMLTQGGIQKGFFVVKGEVGQDSIQFESFKRDVREAMRNAADAWRPPILRISKEGEIDWKTLDRSQKDMEFSHLFDFLVKQACGVYQISPEEINWQIGISGAHATFGADHKGKVMHSQRKGLKPLLTFLAGQLNDNFIQKLNPDYRIEFAGIDVNRELDSEIRVREASTYKLVNEVRAEMQLPPIKGGDIIMNQIYTDNLNPVTGPPIGAGAGTKHKGGGGGSTKPPSSKASSADIAASAEVHDDALPGQ